MRMTSDVLVPRLSKSAPTRSLSSAGTRTWIKLLVVLDLIVLVLIILLYYSVIQKSSILYICSVRNVVK